MTLNFYGLWCRRVGEFLIVKRPVFPTKFDIFVYKTILKVTPQLFWSKFFIFIDVAPIFSQNTLLGSNFI